MEIQNLQLISRTSTADVILRLLAKSTAKSNETNLEGFKAYLEKIGFAIDHNDFYKFFDDLEDAKIGYYDTDNIFIWKYDLKNVSEQILYPNKKIEIEEKSHINMAELKGEENVEVKRRGRPKGARNKSKEGKLEGFIAKTRGRPAGWRKPSSEAVERSNKEVIFFFTKENGESVPFSLTDADKLIKQVESIRSQLSA